MADPVANMPGGGLILAVDGPSEVSVEQAPLTDERVTAAGAPVDRVAAQAWTSSDHATLISVPANVELAEPITVTITGAGVDATTFGTVVVETGANSAATVVVRYTGSGTHADNVNWVIGEGSRVNAVVDADWALDTVHVGQQSIVVKRDATLRHHVATFGGEVVRITPRLAFAAPGGDAELTGVYFADAGQYIENRLLVDHAVPNCRSNVLYKGALQGDKSSKLPEARTCWVGDVLIRAEAKGTDTYEKNQNLLLSDGARADSVPNLEIETGVIEGAGHASATGRFDETQLFYLMARGIPETEARRLIVRGFLNEIIQKIGIGDVEDELTAVMEDELRIAQL